MSPASHGGHPCDVPPPQPPSRKDLPQVLGELLADILQKRALFQALFRLQRAAFLRVVCIQSINRCRSTEAWSAQHGRNQTGPSSSRAPHAISHPAPALSSVGVHSWAILKKHLARSAVPQSLFPKGSNLQCCLPKAHTPLLFFVSAV